MRQTLIKNRDIFRHKVAKRTVQPAPPMVYYSYGIVGWLSETEDIMLRQTTQTIPVAALYARLSKDDEQQGESNSISNQKRILETYAREHGIMNYRFFVDDGWSGANFERPSFKEMIEGVENGEIKTIITKDDCVILELNSESPENTGLCDVSSVF